MRKVLLGLELTRGSEVKALCRPRRGTAVSGRGARQLVAPPPHPPVTLVVPQSAATAGINWWMRQQLDVGSQRSSSRPWVHSCRRRWVPLHRGEAPWRGIDSDVGGDGVQYSGGGAGLSLTVSLPVNLSTEKKMGRKRCASVAAERAAAG